ncbi:hypothetical protein LSG31_17500 [Fodinisporobacter ferrooxydans]|uniref:DUF2642 domain-containing protein n=1 Tax=Fodinisporobacter ferrooxydans TaxID=2901836 RepID=A0ABY4CI11_9BACL|nr:hypothetical protein LSG31_17500 [Alicyclobacillaceae bacterium MYW30-H2]
MDFSFLNNSIGKMVQIERGGPNKIVGKLLKIQGDFLTLEKENGEITYVYTLHVKTLAEPIMEEIQMTQVPAPVYNPNPPYTPVPIEPQPPIIEAASFVELLTNLQNRLVRVNQGGEALDGVVTDIRSVAGSESVTLIHAMKDFVHMPIQHIKSVTVLYQKQEDKKADEKKQEQVKGNNDQKKPQ